MSLHRISELYGLLERNRAMELELAAAAVAEVTRASKIEDQIQRDQTGIGRAALQAGDQAQWAVSQVRREAAEVRTQRLGIMQVERQVVYDAARDSHRISRIQMEQVDSAVERRRKQDELEAERRKQAATDDRYLSRRAWMQAVDARREEAVGIETTGKEVSGSVKMY